MRFISILVGLTIDMAIVAAPVWLLWNYLVPNIFSLPQINPLQAFGLAVLSALLFRGEEFVASYSKRPSLPIKRSGWLRPSE